MCVIYNRDRVFTTLIVVALAVVWVILRDDISPMAFITGVIIGLSCLLYTRKYLPLSKIVGIDFLKLAFYPFYLVWQIYLSGIYVIKIILTGARVDIVKIDTELTNETLRIILADSITLTPGSIFLDMEDKKLVLLWLRNSRIAQIPDNAGEILKSGLEKRLLKAQK